MQSEPNPWFARARDEAKSLLAPIIRFFARDDVKAAWQWLKEPLLSVLVVFALTTVIAQPFYVPSGSMEPTLAIGDAVFAAKFPYGYSRYSIPFMNGPTPKGRFLGRLPEVGDVVVFRLPSNTSITYVKRLIGLPGDRIQMRNGRLWINGKKLPLREAGMGQDEMGDGRDLEVQKYIETLPNGREHMIFKWQWDGQLDNTPVFVVPKDHVFMMGDNRDYSSDSRVPPDEGGVGYVPIGDLVGEPFIVIGSVDFVKADGLWEWPLEFRFSRIFHLVH
ncbi:MAG: signal peptidase I [Alphaproteobacteria bacterium]|nr:signal peptidase I [Alphaproteobacteria bacterium]